MRGGTLIGPCTIAGRLAKLEALGRMRLRRTAEGAVPRVDEPLRFRLQKPVFHNRCPAPRLWGRKRLVHHDFAHRENL